MEYDQELLEKRKMLKGEDKTFKWNKCGCDNKTEKRRIGEFIQRIECKRRYRRGRKNL